MGVGVVLLASEGSSLEADGTAALSRTRGVAGAAAVEVEVVVALSFLASTTLASAAGAAVLTPALPLPPLPLGLLPGLRLRLRLAEFGALLASIARALASASLVLDCGSSAVGFSSSPANNTTVGLPTGTAPVVVGGGGVGSGNGGGVRLVEVLLLALWNRGETSGADLAVAVDFLDPSSPLSSSSTDGPGL